MERQTDMYEFFSSASVVGMSNNNGLYVLQFMAAICLFIANLLCALYKV